MSIDIRIVETSRDLNRFIRFPCDLYRNDPYYVPNLDRDERNTLDPKRNPAFAFCRAAYWLATDGDRVVGRIAGIVNDRYRERWGVSRARFGWVDFVDDPRVADALFATCEAWGRSEGATAMHGPLGFTDLDPEGMLISGFDELGTLPTIYNRAYYPTQLERLGYHKDADWLEYSVRVPEVLPERIRRVADLVASRARVRVVDLKRRRDALAYAPGIFEVLNRAYASLYAVTELDSRQIEVYIKQYFGFIHPDFVPIVVDEHDVVVAFAIAMPGLSDALRKAWGRIVPTGWFHLLRALRDPDTIDLYLVGVRPDYQGRGINALLISSMHEACLRHGVVRAEASPQLEQNRMVRAFWKYFDFRQHKRRRVFFKEL